MYTEKLSQVYLILHLILVVENDDILKLNFQKVKTRIKTLIGNMRKTKRIEKPTLLGYESSSSNVSSDFFEKWK